MSPLKTPTSEFPRPQHLPAHLIRTHSACCKTPSATFSSAISPCKLSMGEFPCPQHLCTPLMHAHSPSPAVSSAISSLETLAGEFPHPPDMYIPSHSCPPNPIHAPFIMPHHLRVHFWPHDTPTHPTHTHSPTPAAMSPAHAVVFTLFPCFHIIPPIFTLSPSFSRHPLCFHVLSPVFVSFLPFLCCLPSIFVSLFLFPWYFPYVYYIIITYIYHVLLETNIILCFLLIKFWSNFMSEQFYRVHRRTSGGVHLEFRWSSYGVYLESRGVKYEYAS